MAKISHWWEIGGFYLFHENFQIDHVPLYTYFFQKNLTKYLAFLKTCTKYSALLKTCTIQNIWHYLYIICTG